ncbi:MAG: hypothetical protein AB7G47_04705 [Mycolicibacterium sp.]|uniref:hypothetical protein n=1 Tax=Mycolicibacterium sp. TaxID=2320850 RepID=UPI003D14DA7F
MTSTIGHRRVVTERPHANWRTRAAILLALTGSAALLLLATVASFPGPVYWAVSSIALAGVLTLFVAGGRAWDRTVAKARAEGVVER